MNSRRNVRLMAGFAVAALIGLGCGGPGASPSPAGTAVDITLQEWAVLANPASAASGQVVFNITNDGPDDVHEFVVVKTDLSIHELPTDERGVVDESGGPMEVIGEIEDIPVGASESLTLDLDPGAYALICNIYDEDEGEAHYALGMRAAFTVNE